MENIPNPENTKSSAEEQNETAGRQENIQETNELPEKKIGDEPPADAEMAPTAQPETTESENVAEDEKQAEEEAAEPITEGGLEAEEAPEESFKDKKPAEEDNAVEITGKAVADEAADAEQHSEEEAAEPITKGGHEAEGTPKESLDKIPAEED